MDESDEHRQKDLDSKRERVEPTSNATLESATHSPKHSSQRTPTDEGTQMDGRDEHPANAQLSMRESLAGTSKLTLERAWHFEKQ
jgi:hypothetical protein